MLKNMNKATRAHAHHLLQYLTVAVRPVRLQELAEVLALRLNFDEAPGRSRASFTINLLHVVHDGGLRVVQFSHFSVKEFLTSDRLVAVVGDVSLHHILLEPAHTILAQACLSVWTIALVEPPCNPLPWQSTLLDHALFENVSSRVIDGIENLFDPDKPHFSRWIRTHDMDDDSWGLADGEMRPERPEVVPVYPPSVSPVTWRSSLTSIRST